MVIGDLSIVERAACTSVLNPGLFQDLRRTIQCPSLMITAATGEVITSAAIASTADIDVAVKAARAAFKTAWGLKCPGAKRAELMNKLADLIAKNIDEIAAIEALNSGEFVVKLM